MLQESSLSRWRVVCNETEEDGDARRYCLDEEQC